MPNDNEIIQEKLAMDILTSSMYSLNFLRNTTVAIFDCEKTSLKIGELYNQWLKKCGLSEINTHHVPYSIGSIIGFLYCGILLAKEKWFSLLPDDNIEEASADWGFSSATYSAPREPSPTIKYAIRRVRNALSHGHILFNVPGDLQKDKNDTDNFEKKVTLKFHDVNPRDTEDTFDIEISLFGLASAIKKFHSIAYANVTAK